MWLILLAVAAGIAAADDPLQTRFQRMDRDGDGFITPNEAPRLAQTRCRCAHAPGQPAPANWVEGYDRNGDSRVDSEEFRQASAEAARPPTPRAAASLAPGFSGTAPDR